MLVNGCIVVLLCRAVAIAILLYVALVAERVNAAPVALRTWWLLFAVLFAVVPSHIGLCNVNIDAEAMRGLCF